LIYNKKAKVRNKFAISDGNSISLLPISIAMVLAIISIFLFTPVMNFFQALFETKGYNVDNTIPMQEKMSNSFAFFMFGLLVYALLPAIAEELIFRGVILKSLSSRYTGFVAITLSSIMFVLMHGSLQQTLYQLVMGIMLGYLAYVGGSIIYSILLHFLNNALVIVFSCFDVVGYISGQETIYYNIFSVIFPFMLFILGLILVGILFWVLKFLRNKNFFRLDENGKFKKIEVEELEEKDGFKGLWTNLAYHERVYMLASFGLVIFIWLINTIAGFM
jgi:membrane protease YdiL (CAAX protease family)